MRVRLPMQGTRVRAPVREDPTCRGAAGPMSHGRWCVRSLCSATGEAAAVGGPCTAKKKNLKPCSGSNVSHITGPASTEVTIKPRQPDSGSPILTTKVHCFSVVVYTRAHTPFQGPLCPHTHVYQDTLTTQAHIKYGYQKLAVLSPSEGPKPSA